MIFMDRESRELTDSRPDHRSESRLGIPQRGALQQSSSPLPQPSTILSWTAEHVEKYSASGKCLTFGLSHNWGAPQSVEAFAAEHAIDPKLLLSPRPMHRINAFGVSPGL